MKLYISTDDKGDIHITDDKYFTPDFPVRFNEMDFPDTGRKRYFNINLKSQSINLNTKERYFVGGGEILDY
jgi:hypothetical protein